MQVGLDQRVEGRIRLRGRWIRIARAEVQDYGVHLIAGEPRG
jgi:hypothetical protein